MLSVEANERRQWLDWIQSREMFPQMQNRVLQRNRSREWDGFIHGSSLDWRKSPEQQVKEMLPNPNSAGWVSPEGRAGEVYHSDLQTILNATMGTNALVERSMQIDSIRFRGTPDRVQLNTPIGNILMEFKTENTYMRDKSEGDKLFKKVEGMLEECRYLQRTDGGPMQRKYFGWTDKQLEDLKDRLMTKTKVSESQEDHMTQMWTYCWLLQQYYNIKIDWCFLLYVKRDSYKSSEFWYYVPQCGDLITKAYQNYINVYNLIFGGNGEQAA